MDYHLPPIRYMALLWHAEIYTCRKQPWVIHGRFLTTTYLIKTVFTCLTSTQLRVITFDGISVHMSSAATRSSHTCLWCCGAGHCGLKGRLWKKQKGFFMSFQLLLRICWNYCVSNQESNIEMLNGSRLRVFYYFIVSISSKYYSMSSSKSDALRHHMRLDSLKI